MTATAAHLGCGGIPRHLDERSVRPCRLVGELAVELREVAVDHLAVEHLLHLAGKVLGCRAAMLLHVLGVHLAGGYRAVAVDKLPGRVVRRCLADIGDPLVDPGNLPLLLQVVLAAGLFSGEVPLGDGKAPLQPLDPLRQVHHLTVGGHRPVGGAERDADLARCGWVRGKLPLLDVDRCVVGAACLALHGAAHELALRDAVDPRPHLPDLREHDAVPADASKVPVGGDRRGDLRNRSLGLTVIEVAACELDVAGLVGLDRVLTGLELGETDVLPLLDATEEVLVGSVEVAKGVDEGCCVGFLEPRLPVLVYELLLQARQVLGRVEHRHRLGCGIVGRVRDRVEDDLAALGAFPYLLAILIVLHVALLVACGLGPANLLLGALVGIHPCTEVVVVHEARCVDVRLDRLALGWGRVDAELVGQADAVLLVALLLVWHIVILFVRGFS